MLTEVEAIINSRPLSYVSSKDLDEPLTPSHMLCGRCILSLLDGTVATENTDEDFQVTSQDLHTRIHNLNRVLDQFWVRQQVEYLLQLRDQYHITDNVRVACVPIPGEVVLVPDEPVPCGGWVE